MAITVTENVTMLLPFLAPVVTEEITVDERASIGEITIEVTDSVAISESIEVFPLTLSIASTDTVTVLEDIAITPSFQTAIFPIALFKGPKTLKRR